MALSLKKQHIENYCTLLSRQMVAEEAGDVIVPDSWPDAETICGSAGTVIVRSRECSTGKVNVSGSVKAWILYQSPDKEIRAMQTVLPYTVQLADPRITDDSVAIVQPRLANCEGKMVNSRKLQVKAAVYLTVTVMNKTELVYCQSLDNDSQLEIQYGEYPLLLTNAVKDKSFTISDELQLENGQPGLGQLLASSVSLNLTDKKLVGTRLVFKGEAHAQVVYLSHEGTVEQAGLSLPFSQIIDLDGVEETDIPEVHMVMSSCELEILDDYSENLRRMELNMNVLAQATMSRQMTIMPVLDFYSTDLSSTVETEETELISLLDIKSVPRSARQTIACDTQPEKVLDVTVTMLRQETERVGDGLQTKQGLEAAILYVDRNGMVKTQRKKFDVTADLALANNAEAETECRFMAAPNAAISGDEIELNVELELAYVCTSAQKVRLLTNGETGEPLAKTDRPSAVVIRGNGDLWQLAKRYGARVDEIKAVNNLTEDNIDGKMIIIPKPSAASSGMVQ